MAAPFNSRSGAPRYESSITPLASAASTSGLPSSATPYSLSSQGYFTQLSNPQPSATPLVGQSLDVKKWLQSVQAESKQHAVDALADLTGQSANAARPYQASTTSFMQTPSITAAQFQQSLRAVPSPSSATSSARPRPAEYDVDEADEEAVPLPKWTEGRSIAASMRPHSSHGREDAYEESEDDPFAVHDAERQRTRAAKPASRSPKASSAAGAASLSSNLLKESMFDEEDRGMLASLLQKAKASASVPAAPYQSSITPVAEVKLRAKEEARAIIENIRMQEQLDLEAAEIKSKAQFESRVKHDGVLPLTHAQTTKSSKGMSAPAASSAASASSTAQPASTALLRSANPLFSKPLLQEADRALPFTPVSVVSTKPPLVASVASPTRKAASSSSMQRSSEVSTSNEYAHDEFERGEDDDAAQQQIEEEEMASSEDARDDGDELGEEHGKRLPTTYLPTAKGKARSSSGSKSSSFSLDENPILYSTALTTVPLLTSITEESESAANTARSPNSAGRRTAGAAVKSPTGTAVASKLSQLSSYAPLSVLGVAPTAAPKFTTVPSTSVPASSSVASSAAAEPAKPKKAAASSSSLSSTLPGAPKPTLSAASSAAMASKIDSAFHDDASLVSTAKDKAKKGKEKGWNTSTAAPSAVTTAGLSTIFTTELGTRDGEDKRKERAPAKAATLPVGPTLATAARPAVRQDSLPASSAAAQGQQALVYANRLAIFIEKRQRAQIMRAFKCWTDQAELPRKKQSRFKARAFCNFSLLCRSLKRWSANAKASKRSKAEAAVLQAQQQDSLLNRRASQFYRVKNLAKLFRGWFLAAQSSLATHAEEAARKARERKVNKLIEALERKKLAAAGSTEDPEAAHAPADRDGGKKHSKDKESLRQTVPASQWNTASSAARLSATTTAEPKKHVASLRDHASAAASGSGTTSQQPHQPVGYKEKLLEQRGLRQNADAAAARALQAIQGPLVGSTGTNTTTTKVPTTGSGSADSSRSNSPTRGSHGATVSFSPTVTVNTFPSGGGLLSSSPGAAAAAGAFPIAAAATMEERAELRRQRREQLREHYAAQEEQRRQEAEALARAALEEEESRRRQEALRRRESKRAEQAVKESKLITVEMEKQKNALVAMHAQRARLLYYGWIPWCKLMESRRLVLLRAARHAGSKALRRLFRRWKENVAQRRVVRENSERKREEKASRWHERRMQKYAFKLWKKLRARTQKEIERKRAYHARQLQKRTFRAFRKYVLEAQARRSDRERRLASHLRSLSARFTLRRWWVRWQRDFLGERRAEHAAQRKQQNLQTKIGGWLEEFRAQRATGGTTATATGTSSLLQNEAKLSSPSNRTAASNPLSPSRYSELLPTSSSPAIGGAPSSAVAAAMSSYSALRESSHFLPAESVATSAMFSSKLLSPSNASASSALSGSSVASATPYSDFIKNALSPRAAAALAVAKAGRQTVQIDIPTVSSLAAHASSTSAKPDVVESTPEYSALHSPKYAALVSPKSASTGAGLKSPVAGGAPATKKPPLAAAGAGAAAKQRPGSAAAVAPKGGAAASILSAATSSALSGTNARPATASGAAAPSGPIVSAGINQPSPSSLSLIQSAKSKVQSLSSQPAAAAASASSLESSAAVSAARKAMEANLDSDEEDESLLSFDRQLQLVLKQQEQIQLANQRRTHPASAAAAAASHSSSASASQMTSPRSIASTTSVSSMSNVTSIAADGQQQPGLAETRAMRRQMEAAKRK